MRPGATLLAATLMLGVMPRAAPAGKPPAAADSAAADRYGATPADLVPYRLSQQPDRLFYVSAPQYRGPGRESPDPVGLAAVRIGLIAPLETGPDRIAGRSLQQGVQLALRQANRNGGLRGVPFELVARNDRAIWGASSNTLVDLAYREQVWAVIGSIDSASTHVALRVALKAEVALVNVGSSDPTVTETAIPWIVRCSPDDRQTGYRLARLLFAEMDLNRVAVLRSNDRYGRFGVREFRDAARRLERPLPLEIQFHPGERDFGPALDRLQASRVEAVVLWSRAADAGRIVREMRRRSMQQIVAGTDRLLDPEFLEVAGAAAEGVIATAWLDPTRGDDVWLAFVRRYMAAYGAPPDAFAAYGHDAATMVVEAIRAAGLNRARIRDALAEIREWSGATGAMHLDATSNNISPLFVARVRGGRFVFGP